MWIKQYTYPFIDFTEDNKIILSFTNIKFIQIGVECPHSIPIFLYNEFKNNELLNGEIFNPNSESLDIKISEINDNILEHVYKINSPDILEFNNLNKKNLVIEIPSPKNPYTIITIAYDKED